MLNDNFLFSISAFKILTFTICPISKASLGFAIFSSVISFIWTNPSTPGNTSTNAPKFNSLATFPSNTFPSFKLSLWRFQGSLFTSFKINDTFSFSASTLPTKTTTLSPTETTSSTLFTFSHAKSLIWIRPVIPPISTIAPTFNIFVTTPSLFSPDLTFFQSSFLWALYISSSITLLEATTFLFLKSSSISLTSNSLPKRFFNSILSLAACDAGINTLIDP